MNLSHWCQLVRKMVSFIGVDGSGRLRRGRDQGLPENFNSTRLQSRFLLEGGLAVHSCCPRSTWGPQDKLWATPASLSLLGILLKAGHARDHLTVVSTIIFKNKKDFIPNEIPWSPGLAQNHKPVLVWKPV